MSANHQSKSETTDSVKSKRFILEVVREDEKSTSLPSVPEVAESIKTDLKENEAPRPHGRGIFSSLLRQSAVRQAGERNPSEAENSLHLSNRRHRLWPTVSASLPASPNTSQGGRPRFPAKEDKTKNLSEKIDTLFKETKNEDSQPRNENHPDVQKEQEEKQSIFTERKTTEPSTLGDLMPKKEKHHYLIILIIVILLISGLAAGGIYLSGKAFQLPPMKSSSTPTPALVPVVSSPSPEATPTPDIAQYKIAVLNGSKKTGEAKKLADKLTEAGYQVVKSGNATNQNAAETTISSKTSVPDGVSSSLQQLLQDNYTVSVGSSLEDNSQYDIVITIGK
jgi:hypothetical protein